MLISFSVANSRSILGEAKLLMTRAKRRETDSSSRKWDGWAPYSPVAGLFGANASGKSNFLSALGFFQSAITESHSSWATEGIPLIPTFAMTESPNPVSSFEAEVLVGGTRYQYGFEMDADRVVKEWLYSFEKKRRTLFERDADAEEVWYFGDSMRGRNRVIADLTRANSLFLSAAAANNHAMLGELFAWFSKTISFVSPNDVERSLRYSIVQLQEDEDMRPKIMSLLQNADLGILDVQFDYPEIPESQVQSFLKRLQDEPNFDSDVFDADFVRTSLSRYRADIELGHVAAVPGGKVNLPLTEESTGTRALLGLSGPIFEALDNGRILVIDEIDTSLHPVLVRAVINLFKSRELNRKGAQLLFSSHDVSLLMQDMFDVALLDRDQIWFVEKSDSGESRFYPLTDFKTRESHSLLRGYLQGRYGAVPRIDWRDMVPTLLGEDSA